MQQRIFAEVDRYRYVGEIGAGGIARVVEVEHTELGSRHAMKILKVLSPDLRARLLAEGRLQARLKHPNIVSVSDVVRLGGGFPALVLDLVEGPSMDALPGNLRLTLPQVDAIARGLLRGLAAAHAQNCVHRDLKPGNVLLKLTSSDVIPMIADFGLAKSFREDGESNTQTGMSMGTPRHMAPEQYTDAKNVDHRADLFSMGTILYELLTGSSCFPKGDFITVYGKAREGNYPKIPTLVADAPQRMIDAIEASLQPDPANRPADAEAMLAIWSGGEPDPKGAWDDEDIAELRRIGEAFVRARVAEDRPTEHISSGHFDSRPDDVTVLDLPTEETQDHPSVVTADGPVRARSLAQITRPVLQSSRPQRPYTLLERVLWQVVLTSTFGFSVLVGLILARLMLGST